MNAKTKRVIKDVRRAYATSPKCPYCGRVLLGTKPPYLCIKCGEIWKPRREVR